MSTGSEPSVPVLRGPHVVLRPPSGRDADALRRLGRDPSIFRCFGEQVDEWRELSAEEADEELIALRPTATELPWAIEVDGRFVGSARLHSMDTAAGTAAYAIGILSPDHLGRGLGTEVTRLILDYGFSRLGLDRVTVRVLDFNERAIACYAECGFAFERRVPHVVELDGEWHDDLIMRARRDAVARPRRS